MVQNGCNKVYIATSLDGYIADANGRIEFLDTYPMPEGDDMGYYALISSIDAILMGRKSFETVLGFGIQWPYTKPVYVWSQTLGKIPDELQSRVKLVKGDTAEVVRSIQADGYANLYVDGGKVIQSFLKEDLIDEMTITVIPVLLGKGVPLFGELDEMLKFSCVASKRYENGLVQNIFMRLRDS